MKKTMTKILANVTFVLACACVLTAAQSARAATLDVDVNKPGVAVPPSFYGLMTEEINHSYDGGLFAELIQNRTFQDSAPGGRGRRGQGAAPERNRPLVAPW